MTIIPSVIGLLDFGFSSAAGNSFLLKFVGGDLESATSIVKNSMHALNFIVFFNVLISFITLIVLDQTGILDKLIIEKQDAILSIFFLTLTKIVDYYRHLYNSFYLAARKFDTSVNFRIIYFLINTTCCILILFFDGGIVLITFVNLVITALYNVFYSLVAKKILKVDTNACIINFLEIKLLFKSGFGYSLDKV